MDRWLTGTKRANSDNDWIEDQENRYLGYLFERLVDTGEYIRQQLVHLYPQEEYAQALYKEAYDAVWQEEAQESASLSGETHREIAEVAGELDADIEDAENYRLGTPNTYIFALIIGGTCRANYPELEGWSGCIRGG